LTDSGRHLARILKDEGKRPDARKKARKNIAPDGARLPHLP
jgi:hypothetical protein